MLEQRLDRPVWQASPSAFVPSAYQTTAGCHWGRLAHQLLSCPCGLPSRAGEHFKCSLEVKSSSKELCILLNYSQTHQQKPVAPKGGLLSWGAVQQHLRCPALWQEGPWAKAPGSWAAGFGEAETEALTVGGSVPFTGAQSGMLLGRKPLGTHVPFPLAVLF